jgi:Skp family chaperone for outer membrane proteins
LIRSISISPIVRRFALLAAVASAALPGASWAQGYFIPPQNRPPPPPREAPVARPAPRAPAPTQQSLAPPPPVELPAGMAGVPSTDTVNGADTAQAQMPNIPVPDLPPLPKGAAPPAAVIGVLGVPEILRASVAGQQVERVMTERLQKLNDDVQKEQLAWRDLQQQLGAQRASLSADQARQKEKDLQERITNAQNTFRDRNRIIQEQAQYCRAQIERTLIGVIRQVAESRGMNLVLHRAQVALNINEFDITDQVTQQMNKVLPTVNIPPEGVSPMAQASAQPGGAPVATPASAAPGSAPTPKK